MKRKIRMGMVGGGRGAFIGGVHRMAAALDGEIELVCGAFSADPEKSRLSGEDLCVDPKRVYGSFKEMMKVKEYGELRDALMSHEKAKRTMDEVAEEIEKELGLDKGVISLTREIVNLLAWSPETIDARKQIAKFESNLLKEDTKASRPPIGRTMYPGGPTFDSFLSAGGVEAMLEQIQIWTHAKDWLILTYEGMQGLIKNLQVFQDMVGGKDIYENLSARRKALNELIFLSGQAVYKDVLYPTADTFYPINNTTKGVTFAVPVCGFDPGYVISKYPSRPTPTNIPCQPIENLGNLFNVNYSNIYIYANESTTNKILSNLFKSVSSKTLIGDASASPSSTFSADKLLTS